MVTSSDQWAITLSAYIGGLAGGITGGMIVAGLAFLVLVRASARRRDDK